MALVLKQHWHKMLRLCKSLLILTFASSSLCFFSQVSVVLKVYNIEMLNYWTRNFMALVLKQHWHKMPRLCKSLLILTFASSSLSFFSQVSVVLKVYNIEMLNYWTRNFMALVLKQHWHKMPRLCKSLLILTFASSSLSFFSQVSVVLKVYNIEMLNYWTRNFMALVLKQHWHKMPRLCKSLLILTFASSSLCFFSQVSVVLKVYNIEMLNYWTRNFMALVLKQHWHKMPRLCKSLLILTFASSSLCFFSQLSVALKV